MPYGEGLAAGAELDAVPVFPLPGLVLLPGQRLPLHIFEPRYRAMVRDLIGAPAPYMAVACVLGEATAPSPDFCAVAGLGRLVGHQRHADGRFHIVLEGVGRVRLEERPFVPPYRRARAVVLPEPDDAGADGLALASLLAVSAGYVAVGADPAATSASALCLSLAARGVLDPAARQAILESTTVAEQLRRTVDALALARAAAQGWSAAGRG